MVAGVDVGAHWLHCVALDEERAVCGRAVFAADDVDALRAWCADADIVAVDAPAQPSSLAHAGDETLAPKFRSARCAEVALGREHRVWVPWVAPAEPPADGWIAVGLRVFDALGTRAIEVFPNAIFRALAGGRVATKKRAHGRAVRVELLRAAGVSGVDDSWSHDELDAAAAALVAADAADGVAVAVGCGHDGSAIWLPRVRLASWAGGSSGAESSSRA